MGSKEYLISTAEKLCLLRKLNDEVYVGEVAAVLETTSGKVYSGISIVAPCGIGFCAEHSAIAEMLKNRESEIKFIVAMSKGKIIPPCGRCRELIRQINPLNYSNTQVIISYDSVMTLNELLPKAF